MTINEFNDGDKVRVTETCCSIDMGDIGTIRDGRFYSDTHTGWSHVLGNASYSLRLELFKSKGGVEAGKTYNLLPDPKFKRSDGEMTGPVFFDPKPERVEILRASNLAGAANDNWIVQAVDGSDVGTEQTVHESFLAEVMQAPAPEPAKRQVGKDYRLLPDRKVWSVSEGRITDGVYFDADVTRVQIIGQGQNGNYDVRSLNGSYDVGRSQLVHSSSLAEIDDPKAVEKSAEQKKINELGAQVDNLRKTMQTMSDRHQKNIQIISEKFMEEAEARGWCREYDDFVKEEVNPYLSLAEMKTRVREFTVMVSFTQAISVEAADEDDAIERARESDEYGNVSSYDEDEASAE